jgi:tetratricopeptide (TPR) repeat protein
MGNLAFVLLEEGKAAESEPLMVETYRRTRASAGERSELTLVAMNNLGYLYKQTGRLAEAEAMYAQLLAFAKSARGGPPSGYRRWVNNMGRLLQAQNRLDDAEPYLREAIDLGLKQLGPEHPDTMHWKRNLAGLNVQQGRFLEAAQLLEPIDATFHRIVDANDPKNAYQFDLVLAKAWAGLQRNAEAARRFEDAGVLLGKGYAAGDPEFGRFARAVQAFQEHWHAAEPAAGHDREAASWAAKAVAAEAEAKSTAAAKTGKATH